MFNPEELAYQEPEKKKTKLPSLPKISRPSKPVSIIVASLLGVVLLGAGGWYSYTNLYKQFSPPPKEQTQSDAPPQQVLGLIESVENKGADLPDNELPSVATIKDLSKLSDQAFFNGATIGDKVLIYAVAKKAVLFRPSTNQIIRESKVEIAGENEQPTTSSQSAVLSASESAKQQPVLKIKF